MSRSRRDYETESGVRGQLAAEEYSLKRLFSLEFSRPEPTGGRWFQFGPFGKAGEGRPKGKLGIRKGNRRKMEEA